MLKGKVCIVTGGTRGIGFEIVRKFLKNGAKVALYGSKKDSALAAVEKLKNEDSSYEVIGLYPDLTDEKQVKDSFEEVKSHFGKIDVLVNNAGITKDGLLMRMSDGDFNSVLDINLKGAFHTIRSVSHQMMKQRGGRIINISSVSGILGNAGQANYSASKAGLIGLTKSAARELAPRGITVNAVAPGFVETEMTEVLPESVKEGAKTQIPLGYM